jgi:hypothetical protein
MVPNLHVKLHNTNNHTHRRPPVTIAGIQPTTHTAEGGKSAHRETMMNSINLAPGEKFHFKYEDGEEFTASITRISLSLNSLLKPGNVWIYFDADESPLSSEVFADYIKKGFCTPV